MAVVRVGRLFSSMPSSLADPAWGEVFDEDKHTTEFRFQKYLVAKR
jgi:hypothetical protein